MVGDPYILKSSDNILAKISSPRKEQQIFDRGSILEISKLIEIFVGALMLQLIGLLALNIQHINDKPT